MLVSAILEIIAIVALLVLAGRLAQVRLEKGTKRRRIGMLLSAAIACSCAAALIDIGAYFQAAAGVNLHLPGSLQTKAALWLKDHEGSQPDRSRVAQNTRILADGLAFYGEHKDRFPDEAKTQMDELAKLPTKITHVLNYGEEGRYYRAAQDTMAIIKALAEPPRQKTKE